jgi:hypothetical protein
MGLPSSGKTTLLDIITLGAMASGFFVPWVADGGGRHDLHARWKQYVDWITADLDELRLMLGAAAEIAKDRRESSHFQRICRETPGILITLEEAHLAFADSPDLVPLVELLVRDGPDAGVALVVTVPDGNIARFGGSQIVRSLIGKTNRTVFGQVDGAQLLEDLD